MVATWALICYCARCIVCSSSDVLYATNRKCFPKRLRLGRYMSAINRQASGFSSRKEEGAHRGISTDTLQRTETAFARYTSLEKNVRRFVRCIPSPEAPGIDSIRQVKRQYTISHQYLHKIRFPRRIISSNRVLRNALLISDTIISISIYITIIINLNYCFKLFKTNWRNFLINAYCFNEKKH